MIDLDPRAAMIRFAEPLILLIALATPLPGMADDAVAGQVLPASTDGYAPIRDRDQFLSLVTGKELRLGRYGVRLTLAPDGTIAGRALGWGLDGSWTWEDGYFCREMDWSGYEIPLNCQLVEVKDNAKLRFTVDRGAGDSASFTLR
jgi:hypothetical protein